jgi:tripartite-type tricarboxylate transporter receptor subunit TctC
MAFVVAPNLAAQSMAELIALAKAQPNKLNYASAGIGSIGHLTGELLKNRTPSRHRSRAVQGRLRC